FKTWLIENKSKVVKSSAISKAINYALSNHDRMVNYLDDGRIQIDNNLIENAIRPVAIGRKNYLFAGNDKAAENTAMIYSFFANCINHDVNPFEWLTDVFSKIIDYKNSKLAELLPMNWKNSQNL
ncbi:MAG: transposase, partial [Marinifilaceae bacterium]|nr:transposase [Marinifilaceae bacterium]